MTKKKTIWKSPNMIPNKKKDMLKIIKNPESLNKVLELISSSSNLMDKVKTTKALSMEEWFNRCVEIIPENIQNLDGFIASFKDFIENYGVNTNVNDDKQ